jgi:hypothetical protein
MRLTNKCDFDYLKATTIALTNARQSIVRKRLLCIGSIRMSVLAV